MEDINEGRTERSIEGQRGGVKDTDKERRTGREGSEEKRGDAEIGKQGSR